MDINAEKSRAQYKHEVEPVVSLHFKQKIKSEFRDITKTIWLKSHYQSNALTKPWTVMVKFLNAVIAYGAVRSTGRSVKHAGVTVFDLDSDSIHKHFFCPRQPGLSRSMSKTWLSVTLWLRRIQITRYDSRVSPRGYKQKY